MSMLCLVTKFVCDCVFRVASLNWNMAEKVVASKDPLTNARSGLPKTPGGTSVSSLFTWLGWVFFNLITCKLNYYFLKFIS